VSNFWQATLVDFLIHGDAYWITLTSRSGAIVELWPVSPELIEPQWPSDGSQWISHYLYQPEGVAYLVPIEHVVHFRDRSDPANPRKGLGRVRAVLREISPTTKPRRIPMRCSRIWASRRRCCRWTPPGLTAAQADQVVPQLQQQTTGDRRFRPIATTVPLRTGRHRRCHQRP